ncbi:hypothetical protein Cs7R123_49550 [Catellatospora sp. TT07R-123]|uniref:hypothetical protein n=1 Tax=Catellatospora sp. TT07R-123 TaxID=2733863 RepID=UPI001B0D3F49|nr:hypothetical protein [Catellatospora sp. TT07R-123]GHJ47613.1 hypothetical protein Cs7R123_49550 [Catellatospora sp. TT07R-123]
MTAALLASSGATQASASIDAHPTLAAQQSWQAKISQLAKPAQGCFKATYPDVAWQQSACATPSRNPMVPRPAAPQTPRTGPRPMVVGNGDDISAKAPSGFIFNAIGSFDNVSGVTSVSSPPGGVGAPVANAYSLQLNTDFFVSTACAASPDPNCRGWEQFIFANNGTSGLSFIQYWLIFYNTTCPAGWFTYTIHCYRNSPTGAVVPNQPITNLANLKVSGTANPGSDSVTTFVGLTAYTTAGGNYVNAAAGWKIAEFNVFGDGGGFAANFNPGASLTVRTRINYGGTAAPICVAQGFTGETNNLSFGSPPPPASPPGPAILVTENTTNTSTANCAYATAVGDTHENTFSGLAYDFQASGDFVEARTGTGFEVQARKVSGAPTWPDTSVNSCVGTRTGSTSVVVALGPKLYVNGRPTALTSGQLALPGVVVNRSGNTYTVVNDAGDSMKAEVNSTHIDLSVGMGTWPTSVRGLLANPGNDVTKLEAADGTVFNVPLSFNDLYNVYGQSWRVPPTSTLLTACSGQLQIGNPSRPFFANNLPQDVRDQAQAVCVRAEIHQAWLGNCTLDVAVLGEKAAQAYVGAAPPVLDGNPRQ